MSADQDAICDVLRQYGTFVDNGDFESWIALWTADGCQMPPSAPSRIGLDAIREGMQPLFDEMYFDFELVNIEEASVFGDLGLTRCTYSLRATPRGGGETVDVMADGKALTLYRRGSDGSWKIAYDCFNSNIP